MTYTRRSLQQMQSKAVAGKKATREFVRRLNRIPVRKLDSMMLIQHDREFQKINCLECANCCKTISPGMHESDIRRMAEALKMKSSVFFENYLLLDDEGEYVFRQTPCPFLTVDNYCTIYEYRPKACREYPHTNRKRFYQILDRAERNMKVCPAVFNIFENLRDGHRDI